MADTNRPYLEQIARSVREAAVSPGREQIQAGPFIALLHPSSDMVWLNYAVPTRPIDDIAEARGAIEDLRRAFDRRGRILRFEFLSDLWPRLPALLDDAGLSLQARQPVLICAPGDLRPEQAPGVEVRLLGDGDDDALFGLLLAIQQAGFSETDALPAAESEEIARTRQQVRDGALRCALAYHAGAPAGAGVAVPTAGMAELAGIATLPRYRRKGVAATLSSVLARDHFDRGGTLAWLSAADATAQSVYERIGFRLAGTQLNYIAVQAS